MWKFGRNLVSPKKPNEFKFGEIVEIVQKDHDPKPSVIVQRYRFNSRSRRAGESVAAYVARKVNFRYPVLLIFITATVSRTNGLSASNK